MENFERADIRLSKALIIIGKNTHKLTPGTLKRFERVRDAWQKGEQLQHNDRLYCLSVERWLTELGGKLATLMRNQYDKREQIQPDDDRDKRLRRRGIAN